MARLWGIFLITLSMPCLVTTSARAQSQPLLPLSESAGHLELALHARSMQASARRERAAWVTLTLPLDKLALPRVAQQPALKAPQQEPPSPSPSPPAPATAPAPPPAGAEPPLVSFEQLRALSEFSQRATVVALSVAGTAAERRRLDSLSSRARASALLPELRLRAVRNTDQALRWVPTTDDPYRVTQADGAGLILEASATFRLDRLLFAREELTVERLRLHAGEARLALEGHVRAAVLGLFRARELACAEDPNDPARLPEVVKVLEQFAALDDLTAGWFSEQAPSLGRAVWGFPEAVLGVCSPPPPPPSAAGTKPVASLENSE